jgi:hypothetical protein
MKVEIEFEVMCKNCMWNLGYKCNHPELTTIESLRTPQTCPLLEKEDDDVD